MVEKIGCKKMNNGVNGFTCMVFAGRLTKRIKKDLLSEVWKKSKELTR
jgi:Fe-S cluster biosynthesis and repair protein YggX